MVSSHTGGLSCGFPMIDGSSAADACSATSSEARTEGRLDSMSRALSKLETMP
jgi:hypothetical protein